MTTDTSTTSPAQEAVGTSAEEARHLAGVAADETKGVAAEAAQQARGVVDDAITQVRGQLDDQGRQQKDRLAGTLATLSDDLSRMAGGGSGLAADLARDAAGRARSVADHLDRRQPDELLDDVRRFARERPGTFLLGALTAGVVVGRLLRGTKDAVEAADAGAHRTTTALGPDSGVRTAYDAPMPPPIAPPPPPPVAPSPSPTGYPSAPGLSGATDAEAGGVLP